MDDGSPSGRPFLVHAVRRPDASSHQCVQFKTVQAFVIDPLGLIVEVVRSLEPRDQLTFDLDRRRNVLPAAASKIVIHRVAGQIAGLVGFIGVGVGKRRQMGDVEDLADRRRVVVRAPPYDHCPWDGGVDIRAIENKTETLLDAELGRRQSGAMTSDSKATTIGSIDRINLRLPAETFDAIDIDACRAQRTGVVSRNTWLTEAVEEKLARERANVVPQVTDRLRHG